ncbi:MAG: hypothetical protein WGN25_06845 [Candidatus Electrothrix sp. GW3-4]|uniref:hypothetical protein n=1 Tax=Candidatus Electrothrix sp. GW3-4 TaxID=3126740 RepID=UPI0030CFE72A
MTQCGRMKIFKLILTVAVVVFVAATTNNARAITIDIKPGELTEAIKHLKDGTVLLGSPPPGYTGLTTHVAAEKARLAQQQLVKEIMLNNIDKRPQAIKDAMEFNIMTPLMTQLVRQALKPKLQMDIAKEILPEL